MKTEIQYEDKELLVVYKPAGLATQTARVGRQDVVSELRNYLKQPYLGILHRLDQPVEGLLVFAKNARAAAGLSAQLQNREEEAGLHKKYCAVLCGKPEKKEAELVDYLYKNENNAAVILDGASCRAKRAALTYRVLQAVDSPAEMTLAEIILETGRFHQIRAQMAYHGMPLLGDIKYGDAVSKELSRELSVRNVALCACELEFGHPVSGERMRFRVRPRGQIFSFFSLS